MNDSTQSPAAQPQDVWPEEIRLSKAKDRLEIRFDDGAKFSLSAELLRVESPSAEVQGHGAGQKTTPVGKQDILISSIEPVGNYAIRIGFSDGHNTGLFSWPLLYDYALRQDQLMGDYLERLDAAGARRK
ncbi:MAG: gamma-butyrobetaine hydroxylase-like domain-containing protein [Candidatus Puniceispirillaceae bacterium]